MPRFFSNHILQTALRIVKQVLIDIYDIPPQRGLDFSKLMRYMLHAFILLHISLHKKKKFQSILNRFEVTYYFEPVVVKVIFPELLVQANKPSPSLFVRFIFPHRTNPLLEQRVVATRLQLAHRFNVVKYAGTIFFLGLFST